jgi:hypothetical protein
LAPDPKASRYMICQNQEVNPCPRFVKRLYRPQRIVSYFPVKFYPSIHSGAANNIFSKQQRLGEGAQSPQQAFVRFNPFYEVVT